MNLGGPEVLILVALAVLVFGAGWLPKAARNLGKAKVEFDKTTQQLTETKDQFIEASGVKELDATIKKANKALNTTPQGLLKGAAASAMKPTAAAKDGEAASAEEDGIEDAEIVKPAVNDAAETAETTDSAEKPPSSTSPDAGDTNLTVDFSD